MSKNSIKISELFSSIQGEGIHVGAPSIFLRTFGCNFTCKKFGIKESFEGENPEVIEALRKEYTDFNDLPLVSTGCDSYGSWHPKLKHLSPLLSIDAIIERIGELKPTQNHHLVITGGEPLLGWQRSYPELIEKVRRKFEIDKITFETNGTQQLYDDLTMAIAYDPIDVTFSVSPKLSGSGEKWEDAIKPDNIVEYQETGADVFLKFVVSKDTDIEEIRRAVEVYESAGFYGKVYLMAVGGVEGVYNTNARDVALMAMDNGWYYSPRLQVDLFGNAWAT